MKQTAVEWLMEKMMHPDGFNPYIEQAKEIEKQQIKDAYQSGVFDGYNKQSKDYYNETFKQDETRL